MTINLSVPTNQPTELKPRIMVIGVGGAGGNAVNNMIRSGLEGVEFLVANSDAQALALSESDRRIQLGVGVTAGLGAGANPDIGRAAAEESLNEILEAMQGSNMVFITAGLGGGTGTGAGPVIARAARECGVLTVGVVTKPFQFEGAQRMRLAEAGLENLQQFVDTLLIIPNQNLFRVANEKTTFADAFKMADDVLYSGVRGVTDLMVMPGLINLDFADIRSVMGEMGKAMMGTGEAEGEKRAIEAAEAAIANPLLDDTSMAGAKGVLINITAGRDITLFEVDEAANRIREEVDSDANIIFGSTFDDAMEGRMRVSVVATGIEAAAGVQPKPRVLKLVGDEHAAPASAGDLSHANTAAAMSAVNPAAVYDAPARTTMSAPAAMPPASAAPRMSMPSMGNEATARQMDIEDAPLAQAAQPVQNPSMNLAANPARAAVAMPAAKPVPASEAFIPPAPVEIEPEPATSKAADPFAAAEMANAGPRTAEAPKPKKRGPSLFERVTGVGRGARVEEAKAPERTEPDLKTSKAGSAAETAKPAASAPATAPRIALGSAAMRAETAPSAPPMPAAIDMSPASSGGHVFGAESVARNGPDSAPPTVTESDPETGLWERMHQTTAPAPIPPEEDDDLLDIPAFLRRQAN
jgi:cell division protein FtsZ